MKRKNNTRNALITSIISLLLCVSMLVGTTFAWFTDEVKSGVNVINAGKLDVELYHGKTTNPTSKVGVDTKLFTDTKSAEIELWEPGVVAYTNLKVANDGNLALKYQMALSFTNANTVGGKSLADVLKIALIPGGVQGTTREAVLAEAKAGSVGSLQDFKKSGKLEQGADSDVFGLVVYWPDDNSNDFDNFFNLKDGKTADDGSATLKIDLGITLFATQLQYEEDSFGSDYDENLWDDAMFVASEEDLLSAIAAGETAIMLEDDIALTSAVEIPAGATVALNLNGKTVSASSGNVFVNNGTLAIEGEGTIQSATTYGVKNSGKLTITDAAVNAVFNGGEFTANNVTVANTISGMHGIYHSGTALTINGGTYSSTSSNELIHAAAGNATINSGEFTQIGKSYLFGAANAGIVINGGTFNGYVNADSSNDKMRPGAAKVSGGTFNFDPTAWVEDGFKAVKNTNGTYTVMKGDALVTDAADLKSVIESAEDGDTILINEGDYTVNAQIQIDNKSLTIIGLGDVTITGTNGHLFQLRNSDRVNLNTVVPDTAKADNVVTFRNVNIGGAVKSGIIVRNDIDLVLEDVTFANCGWGPLQVENSYDDECADNFATIHATNVVAPSITLAAGTGHTTNFYYENCQFDKIEVQNLGGDVLINGVKTAPGFTYWVKDAAELQNALNATGAEINVHFAADITGDVTVLQKEGVNVTIDGNNRKYNGLMTVDGNARQSGAETLTIKNVNFVAKEGADSCIYSPGKEDRTPAKYSYTHNVTVDNCTFTDPDGVVNCAAIRHGDGGDMNWTVKKCNVDSTIHSLLQINNVSGDGITIDGCTVNSKNGINLNQCAKVTVTNCNFDVKGYAVRLGASKGTTESFAEVCNISNSTLKSACNDGDAVIMFRHTSLNATLTLSNTKLEGATAFSGNTADTVIIIDGAVAKSASTSAELTAAVASGENVNIALAEGSYTVPTNLTAGQVVTITGNENTVINVTNGIVYPSGSDVTMHFEGVTINGSGYTNGLANTTATYTNCTFNTADMYLYRSTKFINCTFNDTGTYALWTWGAGTVEFEGCTFNTTGKALYVNANVLDNNTNHQTVKISNCKFYDTGDNNTQKAAIETGDDYNCHTYDIFITETTVEGFAVTENKAQDLKNQFGYEYGGSNLGTNVWGNKYLMGTDKLNVVIDGIDVH